MGGPRKIVTEHGTTCNACAVFKPLISFPKEKGTKHGIGYTCVACNRERSLAWSKANPEKARARTKAWMAERPGMGAAYSAIHWQKHKHKPDFRFKGWMRSAIGKAARKEGGQSAAEAAGFTVDEFIAHMERQFVDGMSWQNFGQWHIDHITPLSSFAIDSRDSPDFKVAWGLANLRPIWAKENLTKHAKRLHLL